MVAAAVGGTVGTKEVQVEVSIQVHQLNIHLGTFDGSVEAGRIFSEDTVAVVSEETRSSAAASQVAAARITDDQIQVAVIVQVAESRAASIEDLGQAAGGALHVKETGLTGAAVDEQIRHLGVEGVDKQKIGPAVPVHIACDHVLAIGQVYAEARGALVGEGHVPARDLLVDEQAALALGSGRGKAVAFGEQQIQVPIEVHVHGSHPLGPTVRARQQVVLMNELLGESTREQTKGQGARNQTHGREEAVAGALEWEVRA